MTNFAYYRLPYADSYSLIESDREPLVLSSLDDIGGEMGFVISPFMQSEQCPIVLIHGDRVEETPLKPSASVYEDGVCPHGGDSPEAEYLSAFDMFHQAVSDGSFHKLVLARSKEYPCQHIVKEGEAEKHCFESAFIKACHLYPRLMIILFSTPQTGTWLIASPEILVEGRNANYHTVALAGTMPYKDGYLDWSEKNKAEQHIVEKYIDDTITPLSKDVLKDGPVTMRAGDLVHLRTDFRFHLRPDTTLGTLVSRLHPTPAVCGLPKQKACQFILKHEGINRRYYSGFSGPVNINGETHLYVSLRCAELGRNNTIHQHPSPIIHHPSSITLYAGGGIMPDSTCLSEWQETEQKMKTIASVLKVDS